MESKIIRPWHGGLGDSLQLSTLPEMFSKAGFDVYISDQTPFRNPEIYDFVWGNNPYVKGLSDEQGNCGDIEGIKYENTDNNFIMNWERVNGLVPKNRLPKVYYQPQDIPWLRYLTIADLSVDSLASHYNMDEVEKYIEEQYSDDILYVLYGHNIKYNKGSDFELCYVESLEEYYNIMFSCKKFICLNSGGNSLAAALNKGKENVDCLVPNCELVRNMSARYHFFYPNINYIWL